MNKKRGDTILAIIFLLGVIFVGIGIFDKGSEAAERIIGIVLGLFLCLFSLSSSLRNFLLALLCFGIGCCGIPDLFAGPENIIPVMILCGPAFYFAFKFGRKAFCGFRIRKHSFDYSDNSQLSTDNYVAGDIPDNFDYVISSESELQEFLSSHIQVDEIKTNVAGVSYQNSDGSSRQDILRYCQAGDPVSFIFFEYEGDPAYAVFSPHGQIGNLPAYLAEKINDKYDGCIMEGVISAITGGYDDYYIGCNLSIKIYKEKPCPNPSQSISTGQTNYPKHEIPSFNPISHTNSFRVDPSFIAESQWHAARKDRSSDSEE